jgi:hypothetical protein
MIKLINRILQPNKLLLFVFGLGSLVILLFFTWIISFLWEFTFSSNFLMICLMIILLLGLLLAYALDKKFSWQTKSYFIISIIELSIIGLIANPLRTWQIDSSIEKAQLIINPLEEYKLKYGFYPNSLSEVENAFQQMMPTRTNIGTRYNYKTVDGESFRLWFQSYYGYKAYYSMENNQWIFTD